MNGSNYRTLPQKKRVIAEAEESPQPNYFVSNIFVEKIFDDISRRQETNKAIILKQITKMEEKVAVVMNIKLVDSPNVEERFE